MIYSEKNTQQFMYIIAHICEINLDLFRKKRIRASEYQVSQTFAYPLLKHWLVFTLLSCQTPLISPASLVKLPELQNYRFST